MKNIQGYHEYLLNESYNLVFQRHNLPLRYKDRVKKIDPRLSDDPRILAKVRNFFQKIEDKIESMAYYGARMQQLRRAERGGGPNTGIEALFGLPTIVPNILKRVFGPSEAKFGRIPKDDEIDLEFMRHVNEDFVKNKLPYIKDEEDLEKNILDIYKRAGIGKGINPVIDENAKNMANLYFFRKINPDDFYNYWG